VSSPRIDLRSDTVTRPSEAMLRAMTCAEVGDDVFGDDPTVNRLQEVVAELLGMEAGLFVPSGTMGNQLALKAQSSPGDQIVLEDGAHIYRYEAGAPAVLGGLLVTCIDAPRGWLAWDEIEPTLNPDNVHCAPPRVVCLENTHNRAGGILFPQEAMIEIGEKAHALGLRVHLDGARLWHAHIATGLSLAELAAPVDTVSVCFSKGLGAPVGSVLVGDAATIERAHRFRKMWGGGMRQAGILAGACLYALENNLERLAEDHAHARLIAEGLDHPALKVNHPVETNIVIIDVQGPGQDQALLDHLERDGILGVGFGPGRVRLIPNLDTSADDINRTLAAVNAFH
jgi:threonine aldolase